MRVKLLPSSTEPKSQRQTSTTFLINDCLAIDGGSLGYALAPEEMVLVRHVIVTHAHSDHTASLPIFVAEVFGGLPGPVTIYGIAEVVSALRDFIFNDQIWPDFEKIPLPNGSGPTIKFQVLEPRVRAEIAGFKVTPIPVNHVVPTTGLIVEDEKSGVIFTSDTYVTDEIWQEGRKVERLKSVFVDVSYPDELEELAAQSKHLTPQLLASDLKKLDRDVDVYAVHIKPSNRDQVIGQLGCLTDPAVKIAEIGRVYEW